MKNIELTPQLKNDIECGQFTMKQIAERNNISLASVGLLVNRYNLNYTKHKPPGSKPTRELTDELKHDIESGEMSLGQISEKYGMSVDIIRTLIKNNGLNYNRQKSKKLPIKITSELLDDIENSGMSVRQLADKYGVKYDTIRSIINRYNLNYNKHKKEMDIETKRSICNDYLEGMDVKDICDKYNIRRNKLSRIRKKMGVECRNNDERNRQICEDYKNGCTYDEIVSKHGICKSYVSGLVRRTGIERDRANKVSEEQKDDICRDYLAGYFIKEITERNGVSSTLIYGVLRERGIKERRRYVPNKVDDNTRDRIYNDYMTGHTLDEIAGKYSVSARLIYAIVYEHGTSPNRKHELSDDDKKKILEAYKGSTKVDRISKENKVSTSTVGNIAAENGLSRDKTLSDETIKRICMEYAQGILASDISKRYNISVDRVYEIASANNIVKRKEVSKETIGNIYKDFMEGYSPKEIASRNNVSYITVSRILDRLRNGLK